MFTKTAAGDRFVVGELQIGPLRDVSVCINSLSLRVEKINIHTLFPKGHKLKSSQIGFKDIKKNIIQSVPNHGQSNVNSCFPKAAVGYVLWCP